MKARNYCGGHYPALFDVAEPVNVADAAAIAERPATSDQFPGAVKIPVLMLAAARDEIVSTSAIETLGLRMRTGRHVIVPGAKHELFQETDAIRGQVLAAFDAFAGLLAQLDVKRTLFNVISKSGETPETMAQFLVVREHLLQQLGAVDYKRHIIVTTDANEGAMRQIVNDEGFRDLPIPAGPATSTGSLVPAHARSNAASKTAASSSRP